jgi:hypothetical protein
MRKTMAVAVILSLSGCASTHDHFTERAQFGQSVPVEKTSTTCGYVGGQLNCTSHPYRTTPDQVEKPKARSD